MLASAQPQQRRYDAAKWGGGSGERSHPSRRIAVYAVCQVAVVSGGGGAVGGGGGRGKNKTAAYRC